MDETNYSDKLRSDSNKLLKSLQTSNRLLIQSIQKKKETLKFYSKNQPKSVTFCDYLRTSCENISNRRSRSASNNSRLSTNLKKSILKKSSNNSLSSSYNDISGSKSSILSNENNLSTSASLADIYAELNIQDDFDEKIKYIIKYHDLNNQRKFINQKSLVDYISKKRQKYLSNKYDDEKFSSNSSIKITDKSKNQANKKTIRSKSADCINVKTNESKKKTKSSLINKNKNSKEYKKQAKNAVKNKPLLGFDWALDNASSKNENNNLNKPDDYWLELSRFRMDNMKDCVSAKVNNFNGTINSILENDSSFYRKQMIDSNDDFFDGINHKCIHSFTLNDRLFPVPVYKDKNGVSLCPVCKSAQKESTSVIPQYFKISIPKSKIESPLRVEPKTGSIKFFEDTLSLSDNCMAGHQNYSKVKKKIVSKEIDLKSFSTRKEKFPKLTLEELKQIQSNRDPSTSDLYSKANAMRYDLENLHQKRLRELMPKITP